jgi:hypothetical protein
MTDSIEGQTIRVTTKTLSDGELAQPMAVFYAIAEPDLIKAEAIIREAVGAASNELVEAVGTLTAAQIIALGLKPGGFGRL